MKGFNFDFELKLIRWSRVQNKKKRTGSPNINSHMTQNPLNSYNSGLPSGLMQLSKARDRHDTLSFFLAVSKLISPKGRPKSKIIT